MIFFVDSANLTEIEEALKRGFSGVTTNPSIFAKEPKGDFMDHIGKIVDLIQKYRPGAHLSIEVFSQDAQEILRQSRRFAESFNLSGLAIKIQIGWNELEIIRSLKAEGILVNCTCCMSIAQAVLAAMAGAGYVSLFWGRIRDGGADPNYVTNQTRKIFDQSYPETKIIIGSIRETNDIIEAGISGAHIVTVPPKFFDKMISHRKTDEVVKQFLSDFKEWIA